MSAALSFSHGANDAQKAMGVTAALLVAGGRLDTLSVPLWVKVASGATLTLGTAMGGWTIVRTIGRRIFHLHPIDGFSSQTASTVVDPRLVVSSGAPVSTTHVVASSVVGVGVGRRRWRHVRWAGGAHDGLRMARDVAGDRCARRRHRPWSGPASHDHAAVVPPTDSPDVLGALRAQTAATVDGLDALAAWAAGDLSAAARVRECEHIADDRKRELRAALSEAFSTPLEPEDLFQLSTGLDRVMNGGEEHRPRGRGAGAGARSAHGRAGRGARRGDAPRLGGVRGARRLRRPARDRRRRRRARQPAPGRAHLPRGDVGSRSGSTIRTRSRPAASSTAGWRARARR